MAPSSKKRSAEDAGVTTRSAKAARTGDNASPRRTKAPGRRAKKGPRASLAPNTFKSKALPLHVNITHTPPPITDGDFVSSTAADPGFIGSSTLLPSVFSTGSYGWKGNKRVTIELPNENGEKEKVQVMITINAAVIGSKQAKDGQSEEDSKDGEVNEEDKPAGEDDVADSPKDAATEE